MAEHPSDPISYLLVIAEWLKADLGAIRQWDNLKVAYHNGMIWVKDLNYLQANSAEVKRIPFKTVYYEQQGKLFLQHHLLPEGNLPALLWTPIGRAFPVTLPAMNHHYFGVAETLDINLIPAYTEAEAAAMVVDVAVLETYLNTAPLVRLQPIQWVLLNPTKALLVGNPLLPVSADVYWSRKRILLPAGYDLDLHVLADTLNTLVNPYNDHYVVWNPDNTYTLVPQSHLQPLTPGSFRKTFQFLTHQQ